MNAERMEAIPLLLIRGKKTRTLVECLVLLAGMTLRTLEAVLRAPNRRLHWNRHLAVAALFHRRP